MYLLPAFRIYIYLTKKARLCVGDPSSGGAVGQERELKIHCTSLISIYTYTMRTRERERERERERKLRVGKREHERCVRCQATEAGMFGTHRHRACIRMYLCIGETRER